MIEKYYMFSKLTPEEAKKIEKRLFLKYFDKNTVIYEEDDSVDALYFIQKGTVELFRLIRGKPEQKVMQLSDGDFFGEVEIFDNLPRMTNVKAITDVELLVLLKSDFERLINDNDDLKNKIYYSFLKEMLKRLRLSDQRFREFFFKALK